MNTRPDDQSFEKPVSQSEADNEVEKQSAPPQTPRPEIDVDESSAIVCYANFCRVTGTPEELILDFGLNASPADSTTAVEIKQRLVLNYFTSKRLLHALALSIQRHESAFGMLEVDVAKRVPARGRSQAAG